MMHARREWLLFDDRGAAWPTHAIQSQRKLSCVHHADLVTGLIRNLGFIGGCRLGRNAAVRLHPEAASQVALAAAFYWLADHAPRRVLIDFVGEDRPAEVCTSAAAAIARMIALTRRHASCRGVAEQQCSLDEISTGSAPSRFRGVLGNLG